MSIADRLAMFERVDLAGSLSLEQGDAKDYAGLSAYHYRAARPATATRVFKLVNHQPTLRSRVQTLARESACEGLNDVGSGAAVKLCEPRQATCAVLVESLPSLSCLMRDYALSDRYRGISDAQQRVRLLNAEVRCISRVVVHPQWRGLGLAVRLVRHALATATTPYTEALAAMGRVNPFFERAGMTAYERPAHAYDQRLVAAMSRIALEPQDLGHMGGVMQRINALPPDLRQWLEGELRRWHSRNGGRRTRREADIEAMLRRARERLGLEPVYYLKFNTAS